MSASVLQQVLRLQAVYVQRCFLLLLLAGIALQADGLSQGEFFRFGDSAGDAKIFRNDDDNTRQLCSDVPYKFLGVDRSCFYINNNGIITFSGFVDHYSPATFPQRQSFQTIAPFSGDVDTRGSGTLWFRDTTSDTTLMSLVDDTIHQAFAEEDDFTSRRVAVATWSNVGYFNEMDDLLNSFQCVMASDGQNMFVIFLYSDIQWTNNSAGEIAAQVGFNAGDGVHYYVLSGSQMQSVANLTIDSNVGVPGKWVFKVSGSSIQSGGCAVPIASSGNDLIPTCLSYSYGNQLGGDLITIKGPYFSNLANIQCDFDGVTHMALYESGFKVHCAVPLLPRSGRVPLRLLINGRVQGKATYTALKMETAYRVDVIPIPTPTPSLPLVLTGGTMVTLTWDPQHILPQVNPELEPFNVAVLLYTFDSDSAQWVEQSILVDRINNNGRVTVTIPSGVSNDVVPIAIQVATSLHSSTQLNTDGLYRELFSTGQRVGIWSSEYYYINPNIAETDGRELCRSWSQEEGTAVPDALVADSTPCAPTIERAQLASSGLSENILKSVYGNCLSNDHWINTFHAGATQCYRQTILDSGSSSEQECCYDNSGSLISGSPNGGTIKRVSKETSRAQHFQEDIRPFLLCCAGLAPNCGLYYTQRPSDDGSRFNPPTPAWLIGDPHMITLDRTPYTFNGHGEFTLLTTPDDSFTLQGRMVPLPATPQGTVFSALAARMGVAGSRVMVGADGSNIAVLVNDIPLVGRDFARGLAIFDDFSVSLRNRTVSLQFMNGIHLECQISTQGFMTKVVVGVPRTFMGRTSGLLGVFNGMPEDDLTPAGLDEPVPVDSDLGTIHREFGMTWSIENPFESLFTYFPYTSLRSFSNFSYQPLFDVQPSQGVSESCGGNSFCEFDSTVTGDMSFGLTTLSTVMEELAVVERVALVTCDPPCSNGACIPGNQCSCPLGFRGSRCQTPEIEDCGIINPCSNSERCLIQAGSYQCVLDCLNNPGSELCNPNATVFPMTNTVTIIIAAVSVVGGTLLIIFLVIIIFLSCVVYGRKGVSKHPATTEGGAEGRYHSKTVVGSTAPTVKVSHETLNGDRKASNTSLPAYSDLNLEMSKVNGHPRRCSEDGILTHYGTKHQEDQDYENLHCRAPHHLPLQQVPPPHVRRTSLDTMRRPEGQNDSAAPHTLPIPEMHTVISISPDSEDSGSPRESNADAAAKTNNNSNGRPRLQGYLTPIQDEMPWYQSTPSVMSQGYSSPASPLSPTNDGDTFPPPINPSTSHKSLQLSLSNPTSVQIAGNVPRSQSSMSQSSTLTHPSRGMGRSTAQGFSRSSNSMGRMVGQTNRQFSRSAGKVHSIPAGMDHFTDV